MITELTRRELVDLFNSYELHPLEGFLSELAEINGMKPSAKGIAWTGRLDEIDFLGRLYDLDALESTDDRFHTAREDIIQHCINNCDWYADWIFRDPRFELANSDERLLAFLAETLHPTVRSERSEVDNLRKEYNRLLRRDRVEIHQTGTVSGKPVYGGGVAVARNVQPAQLREAIGQAIRHSMSAGQVAAFCDELRMPTLPETSTAAPMQSKAGYVIERLADVSWPELVVSAREVLDRQHDDTLAELVFEIELAATQGVAGTPKNLIFAAAGPKPDLVLVDAVNNDIQIVRNAEHCLIYDPAN
ncbi:MAG: hypothetical protein HY997_23510 [Mycolicibacterium neoaurum]|nr:hypothetical protein [Mycolicibacterium neoaurum]